MFTIDIDLKDEPTAIAAVTGGTVGAKAMRVIVDPTNLKDRSMCIIMLQRVIQEINEASSWPPA